MGKISRNLLAIATICVFFGVSYAQDTKKNIVSLGKMAGKYWFMDTEMVVPTKIKTLLVPIFTAEGDGLVVAINEVDCYDSTIRIHRMQYWQDGKLITENKDKTEWTKADGIGKKLVEIVCKPKPQARPVKLYAMGE